MKSLLPIFILMMPFLYSSAADTNSLVGEWQTGLVLSQFGPSITEYAFATNGTFTSSVRFTQGVIPSMTLTGKYYVVSNASGLTNTLVTVAKGRTNTELFYFEDGILVLDEGRPTKIFKLKRKDDF